MTRSWALSSCCGTPRISSPALEGCDDTEDHKEEGKTELIVSIDEDHGREVLRFSASYPDRTPNDADIQAICYAILGPGGGTVRALLPEHNPDSRHGHVVHLLEVPGEAAPVAPPERTMRGD